MERIAAFLAQEEERKQRKRAAREARRAKSVPERDGAGKDESTKEGEVKEEEKEEVVRVVENGKE